MEDDSTHFDVAVVGAGIAGAVQALLLARQGLKVLLLEASEPQPFTADESNAVESKSVKSKSVKSKAAEAGAAKYAVAEPATFPRSFVDPEASDAQVQPDTKALQQRSVALSYRSFELLASQGLWPSESVCPIHEIQVTERGNFGSVRIAARDLDVDALGFVVANRFLERHLRQLVRAQEEIEFRQPASATLVHDSAAGVELKVSDNSGKTSVSTVRCNLLVAADGTHSTIRREIGIPLSTRDYDQIAVVGNVECQLNHKNIAHERFTSTGPLALLPLSDRCMAFVYTASEDEADSLKALTDREFLDLLQRRFGGKLGRFRSLGPRAVFPLALTESESQIQGNCVLIGNSARTLHPVAGQGLNLALRDVFALAGCIGATLSNQETPTAGHQNVARALAEFVKMRRSDQTGTVRRTEMLARLFSFNALPLAPFRSAGLLLLDGLAPVRRRFAADSAGIGVSLGRISANSLAGNSEKTNYPNKNSSL